MPLMLMPGISAAVVVAPVQVTVAEPSVVQVARTMGTVWFAVPLRSFTSATLRTVVAVHEFIVPGITVLFVVPVDEAFAKISRNAGTVACAPVL